MVSYCKNVEDCCGKEGIAGCMKEKETVSIVIPAYNAESFISEAIKSCFSQTYRPIEVIVVNDGSKDSTVDVVNGLSEIVPDKQLELRIIDIDQNKGAANALNVGFSNAKGVYICWLSADDMFICKEKTERQVFVMNATKALWSYFRDSYSGTTLSNASLVKSSYLPSLGILNSLFIRDPDLRLMMLLFRNPINGSSMMIKKECVTRFGQFDSVTRNVDGDGDLWMRYSALNLKLEALKGASVFLREHATQTSKRKSIMLRGCELTRMRMLGALERKGSLTRMIAKFTPFLPIIFQTGYHAERPLVSEFLLSYISAHAGEFTPFLSILAKLYLRRVRSTENYHMIDPDEFSSDLDKFSESSEFKNFERIFLRR